MKTFKLLSVLFATLCFAAMVSCEGPEGPAGPAGADGVDGVDGVDGIDGVDGNETCGICHNSGTAFVSKQAEFRASAHSKGTYYTRGGECSGCHSAEGFLARADHTTASEIYDLAVGEQSPHSCRTCHKVHYAYDETDWALTNSNQVTETIFGTKSPDYASVSFDDLGNSNMCLQCHQSRDRGNVPAADATGEVTTGSTHWGPHYGVQGNILFSAAGVHVDGTETYPTGKGHGSMDCISCHMHEKNHSLAVNFEACTTCHSSADNAEDLVDALHDEVDALKHELAEILVAAGAMSHSTDTVWGWDNETQTHVITSIEESYGPKNATITADQAKALWNYMVVYQDHSYGSHNPSYIKALLKNSIDLVK